MSSSTPTVCEGRKTYAYDTHGHVDHGGDRRYRNMITENIVITNKATVHTVEANSIYTPEGDLFVLACNGNLAFVASQNVFIDGTNVIINNLAIDLFPASNVGENIVVQPYAPHMLVKSFVGGGVVTVTSPNDNVILISANSTDVTLVSVGTGVNLVADSVGPDLTIKSIVGGGNIIVNSNATTINISADIPVTTLSSNVGGVDLVTDGLGPDLMIRSIIGAGTTTVTTPNANVVQISSASTDVTLTANTVGGGVNIVTDAIGPALQIMGLLGTGGTTVTTSGGTATIDTPITTLTGFNPAGVSLVQDGTGPSLAIYNMFSETPAFLQMTTLTLIGGQQIFAMWVPHQGIIGAPQAFTIPNNQLTFVGCDFVNGSSDGIGSAADLMQGAGGVWDTIEANAAYFYAQDPVSGFGGWIMSAECQLTFALPLATAQALTGSEFVIISAYCDSQNAPHDGQSVWIDSVKHTFAAGGADGTTDSLGNVWWKVHLSASTALKEIHFGVYHTVPAGLIVGGGTASGGVIGGLTTTPGFVPGTGGIWRSFIEVIPIMTSSTRNGTGQYV